MSDHHHHHHSGSHSMHGKNFIILPLVFCILILGICYLVAMPKLSTYVAIAKGFFSDNVKDFSDEYRNIFVPIAEEEEEPETSGSTETAKPRNNKTVPISSIEFPRYGDQFGELIIEDCQIDVKFFFGDSRKELDYGVGMFTGSFIPGYGGTIMVAGHNNTYFNKLKYADIGQKVKIRTSYGNYTYEINKIDVKRYTDKTSYDLDAKEENLIMYTCYPFDTLGMTSKRCFIYAKYISGPVIDKNA